MSNKVIIETNLFHLVRIKVRDKEHLKHIVYIPESTEGIIKKKVKPEYFYDHMINSYTREEASKKYIVEGDKVYDHPRVVLWFTDGKDPVQYKFKTYEKAIEFYGKVKEECIKIGNVHLSDLDKLAE